MPDPQMPHLPVDHICMPCDIETDSAFFQAVGKHFDRICCSKVNTVDRLRIYDDCFRVIFDSILDIILEHFDIRKKHIFTETIDEYITYRICEPVLTKIIIA